MCQPSPSTFLAVTPLFRYIPAMLFSKITPYSEIDPTEEAEWIIEGLVQKGGVNFIAGREKSHKSFLRKFLVASALTGTTVFEQFPVRTVPKNVLTLIIEDRKAWERRTMDCMFDALSFAGDPPIGICKPFGLKLNNPSHIAQLIALVKREGYDLVTIDPLIHFHSSSENEASEMSAVLGPVHDLAQYTTVLVVHHSGKHRLKPGEQQGQVEDSLRGSSAIGGAANVTVELTRVGLSASHKLRVSGKETESLDDIKLLLDIGDTWTWALDGPLTPERLRSYILGHPGLTTADLTRRLGKRKDNVVSFLKELVDVGSVRKVDGSRQRVEYFVP